jgi:hypothetical protein
MLVGANGASLGEYLIWNIQVEFFQSKVFIIFKYLKFSLYYYLDIYIFKFSNVCVCVFFKNNQVLL